jgi:hypothetical protein
LSCQPGTDHSHATGDYILLRGTTNTLKHVLWQMHPALAVAERHFWPFITTACQQLPVLNTQVVDVPSLLQVTIVVPENFHYQKL